MVVTHTSQILATSMQFLSMPIITLHWKLNFYHSAPLGMSFCMVSVPSLPLSISHLPNGRNQDEVVSDPPGNKRAASEKSKMINQNTSSHITAFRIFHTNSTWCKIQLSALQLMGYEYYIENVR